MKPRPRTLHPRVSGTRWYGSSNADQIFQERQLEGFEAYEYENLQTALPPGPLHTFAKALEELRAEYPIEAPPFRIA
jgi:5'-nucleotidase